MAGERLLRILTMLSAPGTSTSAPASTGAPASADAPASDDTWQPRSEVERLCALAAELTSTGGAALMLFTDDMPQVSFSTSDFLSEQLVDLQYTVGEGPSLDVHREGKVVLEPDLLASDLSRWQVFGQMAIEAGARAIFCFPVRLGSARLGTLSMFRNVVGPLDDEQHADALVLADVAARAILYMQSEAPVGTLAIELETQGNFQSVVHQAAGMVSLQLGINVAEALVRIRAHAFGNGILIADVARDVVNRSLRLSNVEGD